MWILSDRAFEQLIGGDYTVVIGMKQKQKDLSIKDMFCFQFEYETYDGFRKFYNKKLSKVISDIKYIDKETVLGKVINFLKGK
jgi:hypothetical protein